ncbi:MAG TPA: ankyrin repeat domain-containing protein [Pyrinomonadaceae bacterium]|nr:ankyrin repeat domain-containing protein [Pyrinomonadaceae bacterium]
MNTDVTDRARNGMLLIMLVLCVATPVVATPFQQQVDKELDERLLYLLSQRQTPSLEVIQQLIDKGAHVNQPVRYKSALMHAASEGHVEIVKLLLARGAEVNAQTDEGTALMMAVRGGHVSIVKLLLDARADVNAKHRLGHSALIMSAGPSIPEMNPEPGKPVGPPASEIMSLLLARGADVNLIGQRGQTALMEANSTAKVKLLVANGAQLNAKDEQGETALIHAVDRGDVEVVEALLQAGADASVRDAKGVTALMLALEEVPSYRAAGSDKLARRRLESARPLLTADFGDVNIQNENGETLLMRAASLGETEIVKLLLGRGADVNRTDVFGNTAAVFAYEKDQTAIQELLKNATPSRPTLNAFLRAAVEKKDRAKVKELLAAGADANYEYAMGYDHKTIKSTVLILAAKSGDAAIVQMLLVAGANPKAKGLLHGSEHGLEYGTAIEATENPEVISMLQKAATKP